VVNRFDRQHVLADFPADGIEHAEAYAAALNRWSEARPEPGVRVLDEFVTWQPCAEPTLARLLAALDGLYEAERKADRASAQIREMAERVAA
jgi:hypothetical protein